MSLPQKTRCPTLNCTMMTICPYHNNVAQHSTAPWWQYVLTTTTLPNTQLHHDDNMSLPQQLVAQHSTAPWWQYVLTTKTRCATLNCTMMTICPYHNNSLPNTQLHHDDNMSLPQKLVAQHSTAPWWQYVLTTTTRCPTLNCTMMTICPYHNNSLPNTQLHHDDNMSLPQKPVAQHSTAPWWQYVLTTTTRCPTLNCTMMTICPYHNNSLPNTQLHDDDNMSLPQKLVAQHSTAAWWQYVLTTTTRCPTLNCTMMTICPYHNNSLPNTQLHHDDNMSLPQQLVAQHSTAPWWQYVLTTTTRCPTLNCTMMTICPYHNNSLRNTQLHHDDNMSLPQQLVAQHSTAPWWQYVLTTTTRCPTLNCSMMTICPYHNNSLPNTQLHHDDNMSLPQQLVAQHSTAPWWQYVLTTTTRCPTLNCTMMTICPYHKNSLPNTHTQLHHDDNMSLPQQLVAQHSTAPWWQYVAQHSTAPWWQYVLTTTTRCTTLNCTMMTICPYHKNSLQHSTAPWWQYVLTTTTRCPTLNCTMMTICPYHNNSLPNTQLHHDDNMSLPQKLVAQHSTAPWWQYVLTTTTRCPTLNCTMMTICPYHNNSLPNTQLHHDDNMSLPQQLVAQHSTAPWWQYVLTTTTRCPTLNCTMMTICPYHKNSLRNTQLQHDDNMSLPQQLVAQHSTAPWWQYVLTTTTRCPTLNCSMMTICPYHNNSLPNTQLHHDDNMSLPQQLAQHSTAPWWQYVLTTTTRCATLNCTMMTICPYHNNSLPNTQLHDDDNMSSPQKLVAQHSTAAWWQYVLTTTTRCPTLNCTMMTICPYHKNPLHNTQLHHDDNMSLPQQLVAQHSTAPWWQYVLTTTTRCPTLNCTMMTICPYHNNSLPNTQLQHDDNMSLPQQLVAQHSTAPWWQYVLTTKTRCPTLNCTMMTICPYHNNSLPNTQLHHDDNMSLPQQLAQHSTAPWWQYVLTTTTRCATLNCTMMTICPYHNNNTQLVAQHSTAPWWQYVLTTTTRCPTLNCTMMTICPYHNNSLPNTQLHHDDNMSLPQQLVAQHSTAPWWQYVLTTKTRCPTLNCTMMTICPYHNNSLPNTQLHHDDNMSLPQQLVAQHSTAPWWQYVLTTTTRCATLNCTMMTICPYHNNSLPNTQLHHDDNMSLPQQLVAQHSTAPWWQYVLTTTTRCPTLNCTMMTICPYHNNSLPNTQLHHDDNMSLPQQLVAQHSTAPWWQYVLMSLPQQLVAQHSTAPWWQYVLTTKTRCPTLNCSMMTICPYHNNSLPNTQLHHDDNMSLPQKPVAQHSTAPWWQYVLTTTTRCATLNCTMMTICPYHNNSLPNTQLHHDDNMSLPQKLVAQHSTAPWWQYVLTTTTRCPTLNCTMMTICPYHNNVAQHSTAPWWQYVLTTTTRCATLNCTMMTICPYHNNSLPNTQLHDDDNMSLPQKLVAQHSTAPWWQYVLTTKTRCPTLNCTMMTICPYHNNSLPNTQLHHDDNMSLPQQLAQHSTAPWWQYVLTTTTRCATLNCTMMTICPYHNNSLPNTQLHDDDNMSSPQKLVAQHSTAAWWQYVLTTTTRCTALNCTMMTIFPYHKNPLHNTQLHHDDNMSLAQKLVAQHSTAPWWQYVLTTTTRCTTLNCTMMTICPYHNNSLPNTQLHHDDNMSLPQQLVAQHSTAPWWQYVLTTKTRCPTLNCTMMTICPYHNNSLPNTQLHHDDNMSLPQQLAQHSTAPWWQYVLTTTTRCATLNCTMMTICPYHNNSLPNTQLHDDDNMSSPQKLVAQHSTAPWWQYVLTTNNSLPNTQLHHDDNMSLPQQRCPTLNCTMMTICPYCTTNNSLRNTQLQHDDNMSLPQQLVAQHSTAPWWQYVLTTTTRCPTLNCTMMTICPYHKNSLPNTQLHHDDNMSLPQQLVAQHSTAPWWQYVLTTTTRCPTLNCSMMTICPYHNNSLPNTQLHHDDNMSLPQKLVAQHSTAPWWQYVLTTTTRCPTLNCTMMTICPYHNNLPNTQLHHDDNMSLPQQLVAQHSTAPWWQYVLTTTTRCPTLNCTMMTICPHHKNSLPNTQLQHDDNMSLPQQLVAQHSTAPWWQYFLTTKTRCTTLNCTMMTICP